MGREQITNYGNTLTRGRKGLWRSVQEPTDTTDTTAPTGQAIIDAYKNRILGQSTDVPSPFMLDATQEFILRQLANGLTKEEIRIKVAEERTKGTIGIKKRKQEITLGALNAILYKINVAVRVQTGEYPPTPEIQIAIVESVHAGNVLPTLPETINPTFVESAAPSLRLISNLKPHMEILASMGPKNLRDSTATWKVLQEGLGAKSKEQVYAIAAALFPKKTT